MRRLALLLATFGYVGHCPVAPGTAGSAAGLLLYAAIRLVAPPALVPYVDLGAIAVLFVLGCWAGTVAERHYGRTDPGAVVVDEVVGTMITLWWFVPALTWKGALVGFLLFRAFDIWKPFPARWCERLHGGLGIMADDAVAGIYGNLALWLILLIAPALR